MSDSDLSVIFETKSRDVQVGENTVTVTPIKMGNLQAFTQAIKPIASDVLDAMEGSGDLLTTIELHGERMIEAVRIGTGIERQRLDEMLPDDFVRLASAVVEVNADFFIKRLLPAMKQEVETLQDRVRNGATLFKA